MTSKINSKVEKLTRQQNVQLHLHMTALLSSKPKKVGISNGGKIPWSICPTMLMTYDPETTLYVMGHKTWKSDKAYPWNLIEDTLMHMAILSHSPDEVYHSRTNICHTSHTGLSDLFDYVVKINETSPKAKRFTHIVFLGGLSLFQSLLLDQSDFYFHQVKIQFMKSVYRIPLGDEVNLTHFLSLDKFYSRYEPSLELSDKKWTRIGCSLRKLEFDVMNVIFKRCKPDSQLMDLRRNLCSNLDIRKEKQVERNIIMHFDISDYRWPMTSKVDTDIVIGELLWSLSGSSDGLNLIEKNIFIWSNYGARHILNMKDSTKQLGEHDLGPCHGFLWRHYGIPYQGCLFDYTNKGFDQIQAIEDILDKKSKRNFILYCRNPATDDMCPLPKHIDRIEFAADYEKRTLELKAHFCESVETTKGLPFYVAWTSLLGHMLAHVHGLMCTNLFVCINEAYIYSKDCYNTLEESSLPEYVPRLCLDVEEAHIPSIHGILRKDIQCLYRF